MSDKLTPLIDPPATPPAVPYASFGRRTAALGVDLLGVTAGAVVAGLLLGAGLVLLAPDLATAEPDARAAVMPYALGATALLVICYSVLPIWLCRATAGLGVCGLRCVTLDGRRPGLLRAGWRKLVTLLIPLTAAAAADVLSSGHPLVVPAAALAASFADFLMIAVHPRRQAAHDWLSGTLVRDAPPRFIRR